MDKKSELHWLQFRLGDNVWELDVDDLTVDDTIKLQLLARAADPAGRTWAQLLLGLDQGDAVAVKVLFWAARQRAGETGLLFQDTSPKWRGFSYRYIDMPAPSGGEGVPAAG